MQSYYLGLELGGCNEVAALKSDHYTEVPLYCTRLELYFPDSLSTL